MIKTTRIVHVYNLSEGGEDGQKSDLVGGKL